MAKVVCRAEVWYKMACPECSKINWHCIGDLENTEGIDADAIKCYVCKRIFFFR